MILIMQTKKAHGALASSAAPVGFPVALLHRQSGLPAALAPWAMPCHPAFPHPLALGQAVESRGGKGSIESLAAAAPEAIGVVAARWETWGHTHPSHATYSPWPSSWTALI